MTDSTTNDAIEPNAPSAYPETEDDIRRSTLRGISTLDEMARQLQGEKAALRAAATRLEDATAAHEAAIRHARNFSDEARVVFERDAAAALAATEAAVARAAGDALDVTRAVTRQLPEDRVVVAPDVEAVAANRAAILAPVVASAPLTQLLADFRAALQADDLASCYLYANFLPNRLAAAPAPNEPSRPEIGAARSELAALLATARARLRDPAADPIRALAIEIRVQAAAVARPAAIRKQQAEQAARFARGERVAWPADPNLRAS